MPNERTNYVAIIVGPLDDACRLLAVAVAHTRTQVALFRAHPARTLWEVLPHGEGKAIVARFGENPDALGEIEARVAAFFKRGGSSHGD